MIGKVVMKVDERPHCYNGWNGTKRKPACSYTGGHYCNLRNGHAGPCKCHCGAVHKMTASEAKYLATLEASCS